MDPFILEIIEDARKLQAATPRVRRPARFEGARLILEKEYSRRLLGIRHVGQLLDFEDYRFVVAAIRVLELRLPQESEVGFYLRQLRNGGLSKQAVLELIRLSSAGARAGVNIFGFTRMAIGNRIERIGRRKLKWVGKRLRRLYDLLTGQSGFRQAGDSPALAALEVRMEVVSCYLPLEGHVGSYLTNGSDRP